MLDVNAGIPLADEPAILARTIQLVQSLIDVPLSIDSSIVEALEAGLAVYQGKALVNSRDRRGGAPGARPAARPASTARRSSRSPTTTPASPRTPTSGSPSRSGSSNAPPTTASRARTSSSIRSSCRSARCATAGRQVFRARAPAARGAAASTRPAARRTSASGCRTARASTARSCRWRSPRADVCDHEPALADVREAIMAADVLMGNDPECGRWIRAHREPRPAERRAGRRVDRRRRGRRTGGASSARPRAGEAAAGTRAGRRGRDRDGPLVIFTPSGRRGRFAAGHDRARRGALPRRRHRLGLRRARHLRPLPGRAGGRRVPQARHHVGGDHLSPAGADEAEYRRPRGLAADRRLVVPRRRSTATSSSTSRPRARSTARSSARAWRSATSSSTRSSASTTSRSSRPTLGPPAATWPAARRAARASGASATSRPTSRSSARSSPRSTAGGYRVTVAVHDGRVITASGRASTTGRYGVAIDVGSTTIAGHLADLADGAVLASRRGDEPADPLRRGPHEPRLVRDAPRRRRRRDDAGGPRRAGEAVAGLARRAGVPSTRHPRAHARRQPDHASPPARHRPDPARSRAVRAGDRPGRPDDRRGDRLPAHPGARVYVLPCIAGHVGADTAGRDPRRGRRTRGTRSCCSWTSGRTPRSSSATGTGCSPRRARPGPPSRARRSRRPARRAGAIERVRIDRETLEPRFRVIGSTRWSDEPGFARVDRGGSA